MTKEDLVRLIYSAPGSNSGAIAGLAVKPNLYGNGYDVFIISNFAPNPVGAKAYMDFQTKIRRAIEGARPESVVVALYFFTHQYEPSDYYEQHTPFGQVLAERRKTR